MAMAYSEPSPRRNPFSAEVEGELCVWGGQDLTRKDQELVSCIHHFDIFLESWANNPCGELPDPAPGHWNGACASVGHHIYFYGGYNQSGLQNSLYRFDTKSLKWTTVTLSNSSGSCPMRKAGCRMVAYNQALVLFGGYGVPNTTQSTSESGAKFTKFTRDSNAPNGTNSGWTNELHTFDLKEGEDRCMVVSCSKASVGLQ